MIGAGFIGAEMASTAHALGLDVTVVEAMATPLSGPLGVEMGAVVCGLHTDHGVRLRCGTGVHRLVGSDRVEGVELADGTLLPADLVLVGIGAIPNIGWLQGSGLALGNGVLCDAGGADQPAGHRRRRRLRRVAGRRGRASTSGSSTGPARSSDRGSPSPACCPEAATHAPVGPPYFWSDQYDVRIQFAGTTRHGDEVTVQTGDPAQRSFLAIYHRDGELVAVLGMNQVRAVHPVAPPARRGGTQARWPQRRGPGRLEMTRSPARPAPAPPSARPRRRPRSVRDPHAHPVQPDPHAARPGLHGRGVLRRRAGAHLRADVVLRRAVQRPDRAGRLPDGPGRPRERAAHAATAGARSRAFFNVCRHRGARLCTEESGQAQRSFQCPYHAWTYDLDGKLIAAPNLTKMPDIDREEYGLVTVARPRVARLRLGLPGRRARRRSRTP